ncbi:beta-lactamase/transpeptidase-like protein [Heliocybe sulcata]|uniref:Beta-lactamase/transpeptidase-like protein n=1 Tax=Heliocybe sulcata TaxID=5364 RepID=A0A5C3N743_9AGAM|nr:beta-lactamase/transpeptidase-like protein [Heliocybe sulcata]
MSPDRPSKVSQGLTGTSRSQYQPLSWRWLILAISTGYLLAFVQEYFDSPWSIFRFAGIPSSADPPRPTCKHTFPVAFDILEPDLSKVGEHLSILDSKLRILASDERIDGLSVAVVTPSGSLFEGNYGLVKGNETTPAKRRKTTRDTVYRLISLSKLITTVQTWILRDRGALSWDDDVSKYITELRTGKDRRISIQEVAAHTAGIPSNMPPGPMLGWPHDLRGAGTPPDNGLPFPERQAVLAAINDLPPMVPPGAYPVYSNTGFSLLGMVNVAADAANIGSSGSGEITHDKLVQRDIFDPLGMNSSGYHVSQVHKSRLAIPSNAPHEADWEFLDAMNPSGGCFSSLADLVRLMHSLLTTDSHHRVISSHSMKSWMRPLHPWYDDITEQGILWEIRKYYNSWGQTQRIYQKYGQSAGYHTAFSINPSVNYGVIVLSTGSYFDTLNLTMEIIHTVQPAFDLFIDDSMRRLYEGRWSDADSETSGAQSEVIIRVDQGSIWVERIILDGSDVLQLIQRKNDTERVPLWSTGRKEEFRFAFGVPSENDQSGQGCLLYSFGMDIGYARGAAINQIMFVGEADDRKLLVPSIAAALRRI